MEKLSIRSKPNFRYEQLFMRQFNRIGLPWRALLIAAILLPAETLILTPGSAEAAVVVHRGAYGRTAVVAGHRGVYGRAGYYGGRAAYYGGAGYYGGARRVARRTSRRVARRNYYYENY